MDMRYRRVFAVLMAVLMLVSSAAVLSACGKSGGDGGNGSGSSSSGNSSKKKDYDTEKAYVAGKVFVLTGMSYDDEEYDKELIKDMFDIRDLGLYMSVYFEKGGTAYVKSLLYGKDVVEGQWGEKDGVTLLQVEDDLYDIKVNDDGSISTLTNEEDGEGFLITLHEPEEVPEYLKEYVK